MNRIQTILLALTIFYGSVIIAQESKGKKTLMAIIAHADDETFFSPLLSAYSDRYNVHLVIVTNGDMGVREFANIPAGDTLKQLRVKEAKAACRELNINEPIFMEYGDGELSGWEPLFSLDDDIFDLFEKHQPDVIITWGPDGGYGHPDHRVVSNIVTEVFQKAPASTYGKLYYYSIEQTVLDKTGDFKTPMGIYFKDNMHATSPEFITHKIPFTEKDLIAGRKAFACHWSQFSTDEQDDIYQILDKSNGIISLREWNGNTEREASDF